MMMTEISDIFELTNEHDSKGKGVIDSGATRTVASALAMERLAEELGPARIRIDTNRRPRFKFGNGSRGIASSTAFIRYADVGEIEIAVIETDRYVPVLISIALLRQIKAVINFETGMMNSTKGRTQLETLTGGHFAVHMGGPSLCRQ